MHIYTSYHLGYTFIHVYTMYVENNMKVRNPRNEVQTLTLKC